MTKELWLWAYYEKKIDVRKLDEKFLVRYEFQKQDT